MAVHLATSPPVSQSLTAQLGGLRALAVAMLNNRTDDRGTSVGCRRAWPCELAAAAGPNLAAVSDRLPVAGSDRRGHPEAAAGASLTPQRSGNDD
jgi:hypothetical protein